MQTPEAATSYYVEQQKMAATTAGSAKRVWRRMGDDFDQSWSILAPKMLETVQLGRLAAAVASVEYTPKLLAGTGQVAPASGALIPERFIETAPDGRAMSSLLGQSVIVAKSAVKSGAATDTALARAESWLMGTLLTVMADTGRSVVGADVAQRPGLAGYVRMLNGPSCKDCIILAGKWFRWNEGFLRHPRCDCRHVPSGSEEWGKAEGGQIDPYEAFKDMTGAQQDKAFGRIEARAIRDGADINRVVNLKQRGLGTAKSSLRFGTPSKLTIDDIYRTAGTRTNAIRMMAEEGYITGPQIFGGNVLGVREGFGQLGKGGKARAASDAVTAARATGVRDPLNRYTMTSAERNLYDAQHRLAEARRTGNWPRSIGANSADKFSKPRPLAPGELATLEKAYANQLTKLNAVDKYGKPTAPESLKRLARLLGIS